MSRLDSYSAAIEDVIVLIRSGRVGMALTVLEGLTGLVDGAMLEAMAIGHAKDVRGEPFCGRPKPTKRPKAPRRHEWLAARIADPDLRERAKAVLRLDDQLLDDVAARAVGLSPGSWRKLRRELGS
jgi:hypothetical protein